MSNYPRISLAGGNQYPAVATATPSQYPVYHIVDVTGTVITNLGNGPADGTWTTMTPLQDTWVAGASPPQYMKDSRGIVHCRGIIQDGTATAQAFTFPVGFRPLGGTYYFHFNVAPHACAVGTAPGD